MDVEPQLVFNTDSKPKWEELEEVLISPPRDWPACFERPPLKLFISQALAGSRVRLCGAVSEANVTKMGGVSLSVNDSRANALRVRTKTGWDVMAGFIIYERTDVLAADGSPAFVARPHWWNAKKNGAWVDPTPRPTYQEVVLVESERTALPPPGEKAPKAEMVLKGEMAPKAEKALKGEMAPKAEKALKGEMALRDEMAPHVAKSEREGEVAVNEPEEVETTNMRPLNVYRQQQREMEAAAETLNYKARTKGMSRAERLAAREAEAVAARAQAEAMAAAERAARERAEAAEAAVIAAAKRAAAEKESREAARRAAEAAKREAAIAEAGRVARKAAEESARAASSMKAAGGGEWVWDLGTHLRLISPHKEAGGKYFSLGGHFAEALAEYKAGVAAISNASLAWPAVEAVRPPTIESRQAPFRPCQYHVGSRARRISNQQSAISNQQSVTSCDRLTPAPKPSRS